MASLGNNELAIRSIKKNNVSPFIWKDSLYIEKV